MASLEAGPDRLAIRVVQRGGDAVELSYADLFALAHRAVSGFRRMGVLPGDCIVIALPTCRDFFAVYLGALFHRIIPLIVPAPKAGLGAEYATAQLCAQVRQVGARCLIVPAQSDNLRLVLPGQILTVEELLAGGEPVHLSPPEDDDAVAHLQLTSGSTGEQRVVCIKHRHIVANVAGIGSVIKIRPEDALVFWLPLFHDMGLIAVSCSFYWQRPMTVTDASNFTRSPIRFWLQMMSRYRATITAAPNSAYEACARIASLREFDDLDLSCCRVAFWGSEPIQPRTIQAFEQTFDRYGYRRQATFPVYGLAEATLAASLPQVETPAIVAGFAATQAVCVGVPLAGHELRIVDNDRRILDENEVGEIELRGPSIADTYWEQGAPAGSVAQAEGFLATGDLGFLRDAQLYVIGRKKEIIIIHGRNFIPADIEALVGGVLANSINKGVAAVGMADPASGTERLHVAIETRVLPVPDRAPLEEKIRNRISETFGISGVVIAWLPKGGIPKTTSGKIQRFKCRHLFNDVQPPVPGRLKPQNRLASV